MCHIEQEVIYTLHALKQAAKLAACNPLILDTETTGLGWDARIVDICLMTMDGQVVFESLIDPQMYIPLEASRIHGITDADVVNAPVWTQVAPHISHLLEIAHLAGYNLDFDLRMLANTDRAYALPPTYPDALPTGDVMQIYADYYGDWDDYHGGFRWQKLTSAAEQLGLEFDPSAAHRARYDCDLTRRVLLALVELARLSAIPF